MDGRVIKLFLALIWLCFAGAAHALTYGFAFASTSATSLLGGSVTTSIQVPGTFSGLIPDDPSAGRYLRNATIWSDSGNAGDELTLLQVVDTDGVVPAPVRAAFPNYPVIFDMIDTISGSASSIMIPTTPFVIEAFDTNGLPNTRFVPSGLYFKMTFKTGTLATGKVFRIVIRWGVWQ